MEENTEKNTLQAALGKKVKGISGFQRSLYGFEGFGQDGRAANREHIALGRSEQANNLPTAL